MAENYCLNVKYELEKKVGISLPYLSENLVYQVG